MRYMLAMLSSNRAQKFTAKVLEHAGITLNGNAPWDMRVHNPKMYRQIYARGNLGLGEAYVNGDWDCAELDVFFDKVMSAHLHQYVEKNPSIWLAVLQAKLINLQSIVRSSEVGRHHYD